MLKNYTVDKEARTNLLKFPSKAQSGDDGDDIGIEIDLEPGDPEYDPEDEEENEEAFEEDEDSDDFDENLAESMSEEDLMELADKIMLDVDADKESLSKWVEVYTKSLEYLGIEEVIRDQPWPNACNVVYPGMLEGIVRFQSRALAKLFPAQGPAVFGVVGMEKTPQLQLIINRAQDLFNHHLTEIMMENQTETDRLLFALAQIGFAVKKVYFDDDHLMRTTTHFVEAEDFILPYGTDNVETAKRLTHILTMSKNDVEEAMESGKWLKYDLTDGESEMEDVEQKKTETTGQDAPDLVVDDRMKIYEVYIDLMLDEDRLKADKKRRSPYIVTIDAESRDVYCIRRNWRRTTKDNLPRIKRTCFAIYRYVPADGSYAFGLVHLTGQLTIAITRILRQVIDAGELANLPGMLKSRAARMDSQDPIAPGEMRDVEMDPEQLAASFFPLPFKEPSAALIQLLTMLIAEAKQFASTADLDISASSQNSPVGTTLALIERQTEISNAVQKRMHTSFGRELTLIKDSLEEHEPKIYKKIFEPLTKAIQGKGLLVILASGDPGSSTMAQRVMQIQAVIQNSVQAPQVYDLAALHRAMVSAMGISDVNTLIPDKTDTPEIGIVAENGALITMKPVKAFPDQDHKSHIAGHMAFLGDPMNQQLMAKAPNAQQIVAASYAHIAEHIAFEYRNEIAAQLGTALPSDDEKLPKDIADALSQLVAEAAARVQQQHQSDAQKQAAQQQQSDPMYALENRKLDIDEMNAKTKAADTQAKHGLAAIKQESAEKQHDDNREIQVLKILVDGAAADKEHVEGLDLEASRMAADVGGKLLQHAQHLDGQDQQSTQQQAQNDQQRAQQANTQQQTEQQGQQAMREGGLKEADQAHRHALEVAKHQLEIGKQQHEEKMSVAEHQLSRETSENQHELAKKVADKPTPKSGNK